MCGRFAAGDATWAEYYQWLNLCNESAPANFEPCWNIAPTMQAPIVVPGREGRLMRQASWWFLPSNWRADPKEYRYSTFNARIDQGEVKPTFRPALQGGRCLVPALGYYEWQPGASKKDVKQPFFVSHRAGRFCFAGLWSAPVIDEKPYPTFSVLTLPASGELAAIHHRMPVVLEADDYDAWLGGALGLADLEKRGPEVPMQLWPVDPRVNKVAENDAALTEKYDPPKEEKPPAPEQLDLF